MVDVRICNRAISTSDTSQVTPSRTAGNGHLHLAPGYVVSNTHSPDTPRTPLNPKLEHHRFISLGNPKTLSNNSSCELQVDDRNLDDMMVLANTRSGRVKRLPQPAPPAARRLCRPRPADPSPTLLAPD